MRLDTNEQHMQRTKIVCSGQGQVWTGTWVWTPAPGLMGPVADADLHRRGSGVKNQSKHSFFWTCSDRRHSELQWTQAQLAFTQTQTAQAAPSGTAGRAERHRGPRRAAGAPEGLLRLCCFQMDRSLQTADLVPD